MSKTQEIIDRLKRQEQVSIPGADSLTPKQALLDASDVAARLPDKHLRFVNLRDPMKVQARKSEGYSYVDPESGGHRIGDDYALMQQDRSIYDAKISRTEALNAARLEMHNREMENITEQVAKQLRDRYGIDVTRDRILVKEG